MFNNLYKERHSSISIADSRSYSCWFPSSGLWIANMYTNGSIDDYVNITHEFAHGIADQITNKVKKYSPHNILLEMYPIMCQTLYLYQNIENKIQGEVNKCLANYLKAMIDNAEEIKTKYIIAQQFVNVTNARNLSRLIKRTFGYNLSKQDVLSIYDNPVGEYICYVFPYIVAMELVALYQKDKDLFKYKVNKILLSNDHPLELIKKLDIVPNKTTK